MGVGEARTLRATGRWVLKVGKLAWSAGDPGLGSSGFGFSREEETSVEACEREFGRFLCVESSRRLLPAFLLLTEDRRQKHDADRGSGRGRSAERD
ncbi:hypothetical protein IEQ34_021287 [Dendrobium chrysotoxum]|uniref:Uncharacterized protein n=1 Tax=Dendrobium chrysotoxum TaxID=161865 RepID=A0AAV7G368_DENCH|nr:hypothetical protein IEQ34_021287 [Dendrobium chrysotoxum]